MTDDRRAIPTISVVILTLNEERHIARAIGSVRGFAHEVLVIDSYSTDRTVELAHAAGARVIAHSFENQSRQFARGLAHGGITGDWILRLDADEVIEDDLARTIAKRLPMLGPGVAGVTFDRKHIFMGRWIRHGGRYPLRLLRLWRAGQGRVEDRWMDEHVVVTGGEIVHFAGGFADANLGDLTTFTAKHNGYATREAIDVLGERYGLFAGADDHRLSRQAQYKRIVKQRLYNRLPFGAGPLGYFLYRYVLQLGFLDGRAGLIYHVLQGFWYRFLVAAKVREFDLILAPLAGASERLAALEALTGHRLSQDS